MRNGIPRIYITLLLCLSALNAQSYKKQFIQWKVDDEDLRESFLAGYISKLTVAEERESEVQVSFDLYVTVESAPDTLYIVTIEAFDPSNEVYLPLLKNVLLKMQDQIQVLKKREYAWDNIELRGELEYQSEVRNVFREKNYKQCRDTFWWTYRGFSISPGKAFIVRPKNNPKIAMEFQFGNEEIGLPAAAGRIASIGLTNEIVKAFVTIPYNYFYFGDLEQLIGTYGGGLRFDSPSFGGSISYQAFEFLSDYERKIYKDEDEGIYNNWAGQLYYSQTFDTYRAMKIFKEDSSKIHIPKAAIRLKAGINYLENVFIRRIESEFVEVARSQRLENLHFSLRFEFVSDLNKFGFNKYIFSLQTNWSFWGSKSIQWYTSYAVNDFFSVNLIGLYLIKGAEFYEGETKVFKMRPGFMLVPAFTLQL